MFDFDYGTRFISDANMAIYFGYDSVIDQSSYSTVQRLSKKLWLRNRNSSVNARTGCIRSMLSFKVKVSFSTSMTGSSQGNLPYQPCETLVLGSPRQRKSASRKSTSSLKNSPNTTASHSTVSCWWQMLFQISYVASCLTRGKKALVNAVMMAAWHEDAFRITEVFH